jgi:hypothetical protein
MNVFRLDDPHPVSRPGRAKSCAPARRGKGPPDLSLFPPRPPQGGRELLPNRFAITTNPGFPLPLREGDRGRGISNMEKFLTLTPCLPCQGGGRSACSPDAGAQRRNPGTYYETPDLRSPSLDSALRASLRLSKIAPGDFVASLHPGYILSASRRGRGNNVIEAGA